MAVPYTDTAALANLVQTAYDRQVRFDLRSVPLFRSVAEVKPAAQSMPGDSVVFNIHKDLDVVTAPLDEITDPAGVSLKNTSTVTVTLEQYGTYTVVTDLLEQYALDGSLNSNAASRIANNLADSVDALVAAVLNSGDNNIVNAAGVISVVAQADLAAATIAETITTKDIIFAATKLRAANVAPSDGVNYIAFIHPDVAADLMTATGSNAWSAPHEYVDTANIYNGELGIYGGVRFISTPRAPKVDGVYTTFVVGKEALAEVVADDFHVVLGGTIVDPLDRKMALGWKGTAGWSIFRPEALWTIKTVSSFDV